MSAGACPECGHELWPDPTRGWICQICEAKSCSLDQDAVIQLADGSQQLKYGGNPILKKSLELLLNDPPIQKQNMEKLEIEALGDDIIRRKRESNRRLHAENDERRRIEEAMAADPDYRRVMEQELQRRHEEAWRQQNREKLLEKAQQLRQELEALDDVRELVPAIKELVEKEIADLERGLV